jgi:chromosome partitioning protein
MAIMIHVQSEKGGVGKTTISLHLALYLNKKNFTTLLIDNDNQVDLSKSLYNEVFSSNPLGLLELLQGAADVEDILYQKYNDRFLFLLGSSQINHYQAPVDSKIYRKILKSSLLEDVDFIIVDNPPSINDAVLQSLIVSDYALIVTDLEEYSMQNTQAMLSNLKVIQSSSNPGIKLLGIVANK